MKTISEHWDKIFSKTEDCKMGWYEKNVNQTLELLDQIPEWEKSRIFLPGVGTSNLAEELIEKGAGLILNDISIEAVNKLKKRLNNKTKDIIWICQDISKPLPDEIPDAYIWIDRAVLHFLTEPDDIKGYFKNVKSKLQSGGYAIFAEFSKAGAKKCAGLTLHRYSIEELSYNLGPSFRLISHFDYKYINPFGDPRPYIYALFKREP